MKKWLLILTLTLLLTLAACGGGNTNNDNTGTKEIVLSYADWGNQVINQKLIDAFMEEYPNIRVELRLDISGSGGEFTGNLLNAQAAGVLPDVFAIDNVPTGLANGMLLDITEYWDADPETDAVYPNIATAAVYNGARFAVPSFQFIRGIYLNITLLERYNIDIPEKDWTYTEYIDIARRLRQAGRNEGVFGIDPWFGALDFEQIFPTLDNADVGYNTWDGEGFNFTSQAWIDAYNLRLDIQNERVVATYSEEEQAALSAAQAWPWYDGDIGMKVDGSWNLWMVDDMFEANGIEVGFWPYPGGDAGQFPPTILDFSVVSSQTENPEEAYLLAKWMTFGRQGWLTRLDIMDEDGILYLDRFPVADYSDVWEKAGNFVDYIEGLRESVELFEFSKPDTDKWLPGYKSFWEWVGNEENDYFNRINDGLVSPETFAPEWEEEINKRISNALTDLNLD